MKIYKCLRLNNPVLGRKSSAAPAVAVGFGLALALATVPLAAAQITYDSPVLPSPLVAGNWSSTTSLPKFDGTLGVLTKITFTMNGNISKGELGLENLDTIVKPGLASLTAVMDLKRPDTSSIISVPVTTGMTAFLLQPFDGDGDPVFPQNPKFIGLDTLILTGLSGVTTASSVDTLPADLVLFTGLGTIDLTAQGALGVLNSAAGNFAFFSNLESTAQFQVVYDFTVGVPESGSTAPVFAGLLGLFGMTFRRFRKI